MGAKGQAYRKRKRARRDAEFKKITGEIESILFSPVLREASEWTDTHRGENPELETTVKEILSGLPRLNQEFQALNRANDKRRARFRVMKK
ncbi:MAG TPA: hypothetical protein VMO00_01890, partial [Methylomirabilota bacterium]|jgi:hypothetical protein|nr:hypothetical protein [Methylomirabilota bacterium]